MNLEGKTFKHLKVVKSLGKDKNLHEVYLCKCKCGKEVNVVKNNLMSGNSGSCGCMKAFKHGHTKNFTQSKTYKAYHDMKARCLNKNVRNYKNYGERGISICDQWLGENGFVNFYNDMGDCPENFSLERIDVNLGYSKENCKWIPLSEQQFNKQNSIKITYNEITLTESQWSKTLGIPKSTIRKRRLNNWPIDKLFIKPSRKNRFTKLIKEN